MLYVLFYHPFILAISIYPYLAPSHIINNIYTDIKPPTLQGNVFVWSLIQTYERTQLLPVTQFSAHKEYITRILLSPDVKKLATCSADHTAKIWEVDVDPDSTTEEGSASSSNNESPTTTTTTTNNPNLIYSNNNNNNNNNIMNAPFASEGATTAAAKFGSSGLMAGDGGNSIIMGGSGSGSGSVGGLVGGTGTGKPFPLEATLQGHQRWVWDCAFSADSAYLVTACSDHYARLWELHSQQVIRQYNGHHRGAVCVALNDYSEAR